MAEDFVIHPLTKRRSWPVVIAVVVSATVAATILRLILNPLIGDFAIPFITFFPAVLFSAWYGGFRAAALCILLSTLTAAYFFTYPPRSFWIPLPVDQISLLIFVVVGFGLAVLSQSQRRALERADHAEFEERVQRQRFETTLASIGDGVIATDADGKVSFMNGTAEALTGWKLGEALGRPLETIFRIIDGDTRKPVRDSMPRQEDGVVVLANHKLLMAREGTEIPIENIGSVIRDSESKERGAVLIFRDITERRRLDRERGESSRAAHQLAAIVESCDEAILSKDTELRITAWNRAAERMFGYKASEAIGQSVLFFIPENRLHEERSMMERIQQNRKVERFESERRRRDGTIVPVALTISPILDASNTVMGVSTVMRDLTERKRIEDEVSG